MTARAPVASTTGTGGVYDITAAAYGATTGATDNSAAIQAAINAAKAAGGRVYVPPGVFKYASPLILDLPSKGFSIEGSCVAWGELQDTPSELRYTGTTSPAISCHSIFGVGIKGIRFTYDNAGFTGDLIDIDGGPHAADCTNWIIEGCGSRHINTITARSIIRMSQAINGLIRNCGLAGAGNCIRFADSGGPYVVGVKVQDCTFNNSSDAHILFGSAGGENNVIDNCRFEAGTNTTAIRGTLVATDGGSSDSAQYNVAVRDCWFGDAGAATTWIKNLCGQSQAYPGIISGCRFATTQAGTHLTLRGRFLVQGNSFDGGCVYDSTGNDLLTLVAFGNFYNTPAPLFNATRFPSGLPANDYVSLGNIGAENTLDARVGIKAISATFGTLGTAPGDLLLGARVNAGYEAGDAKAKVYYGKPPSLTRPMLALQAPWDGADGMLALLAGAAPTEVIRIDGAGPKLAFYGVTPVARPAAYTLNAGATSRNLPAAGTTLDVEKALRQLVTDLQANGLLQ